MSIPCVKSVPDISQFSSQTRNNPELIAVLKNLRSQQDPCKSSGKSCGGSLDSKDKSGLITMLQLRGLTKPDIQLVIDAWGICGGGGGKLSGGDIAGIVIGSIAGLILIILLIILATRKKKK